MKIQEVAALIIVCALALGTGTMIVSSLDNSQTYEKQVTAVAVFVNNDRTTATHVTAAIYDSSGKLLDTTQEKEVVLDSWNILKFAHPVRIDAVGKKTYIMTVSGNGDISIPSTGEDYIVQAISGYGDFPKEMESEKTTSQLSMYAIFI